MATLHVRRRSVHLYLLAIVILAALTVALTTMLGHKPPPRSPHVEAPRTTWVAPV